MNAKKYQGIEARMMTQTQMEAYTGMGRTMLTEFARRIGARKKVGRKVLYDRLIIDKGLDELPEDIEQPAVI